MLKSGVWKPFVALVLLGVPVLGQVASKKSDTTPDFSKEGVVIEQSTTRVAFNSDGTSTREQKTRVRVQSEAGVQQYGLLNLPYQGSVERMEIDYVRVKKPDGTITATPPDSVQDMTSEVSREAPFYSDLREKHVAVKGLGPGDTLEYAARWQVEKPLAPGQFWFSYEFTESSTILDEQLEISVPREREVKVKSQKLQPVIREENGRRIYTWKTSHLETKSKDAQKEELSYESVRGLLPPPDVLVSSFRTWEEVGRWYGGLQEEKVQPSPEVRAKAEELIKGLPDDAAKLRAIYSYVSQHYRYFGIAFGIGRYQPHSSGEILGNQYGDCKDKHTLLAALTSAAGIRAYPALISSRMALDQELPSPGQFDHVISVALIGSQTYWMDTTSEIAPLGLLVVPLREKPALVITPGKIAFQTTPSTPPFPSHEEFSMSGKLGADGNLEAQAKSVMRGDDELILRLAFRNLPQSQWKDLVQRISYVSGFGGTVSDVQASSLENTEEPFSVTYHYSRKDYSDWESRRILAALPPFGLPAIKEEDLNRTAPLWIGAPGEWQYESRIELPKGFSAELLPPLNLKEDFADFQGSSEVRDGVLVTKRHLVLKAREATPAQLKSYKAFQKTIWDDHFSYIQLKPASDVAATLAAKPKSEAERAGEFIRNAFTELPSSTNSEALQAESDGRAAAGTADFSSAIAALKHATTLDPKFARAWIELGFFYEATRQQNAGLEAFQKAVDADPSRAVAYKILAFSLAEMHRRVEAIDVWRKLETIAPNDRDIAWNLANLYIAEKRYKEAVPLLETAAKAAPYNASFQMNLGRARLHAGETDQGMAAMKKALELDSGAEMLNDVAYEMAEADTNFSEALNYSQRSVREIEEASRKVDLKNVQKEDLQLPLRIGAYWDTLGWIYYKMGNLPMAENYLDAAWQLRQDGIAGDHLGQVYEKEQKLTSALHLYSLALEVNPRLEETPARMRRLAEKHVPLPNTKMSAGEELSRMRTVKLPRIVPGTASADFYVLLGSGGKVEGASFLRGSELLRYAEDELAKAPIKMAFPRDSTARVLKRGILSCSQYTGCSFVFYPASVSATGN